jgi:hypothetical protein
MTQRESNFRKRSAIVPLELVIDPRDCTLAA